MNKILLIAAITLPLLTFAEEETMGYLGVLTTELDEAMKIAVDLDHGILVQEVVEDSPAEKGGIKTGDIILEIAGEKIVDYKTLKNAIKKKPNEKVKMVIYRSKKPMTKSVELGEKKATKIEIDMDIPELYELKGMFDIGKKELKAELEKLKVEMEKLKEELKELKEKYK